MFQLFERLLALRGSSASAFQACKKKNAQKMLDVYRGVRMQSFALYDKA